MNRNKARKPLAEHPWRKGYIAPGESTGYAEAARWSKAEKLVSAFYSTGWSYREVSEAYETSWKCAARQAHVKIPTEQERALVIAILKEREERNAKAKR